MVSSDKLQQIESLVDRWLHDTDVPGVGVCLVDETGKRWTRGFGARSLEDNAPATAETLFGMGSISKAVTSLAIMQLVEAGVLAVDDEVDAYIDHFDDVPGPSITVESLLTHTSGFPATGPQLIAQILDGTPAGVSDDSGRKRWIAEAADRRVLDTERFFYFNMGYGVLGSLIEAIDGRSYETYIEEEIFEPLGMTRSTFDRETFEADDNAMTPYRPTDDGIEPAPFPFDELIYPSGGLVSSPVELSYFLHAMMTDGGPVCSSETLEPLQRGRVVRERRIDGVEQRYGYGWMSNAVGEDTLYGHGGSVIVSTAYMGYLEEANIGVTIACNSTGSPHPMYLGEAVLALASGLDVTAVPAFALEQKFEALTGEYATFREGLTATVERTGAGLALSITSPYGDRELPLFPESADRNEYTFYTVLSTGTRVPVEFDVTGEGVDLFFQRHRFSRRP